METISLFHDGAEVVAKIHKNGYIYLAFSNDKRIVNISKALETAIMAKYFETL